MKITPTYKNTLDLTQKILISTDSIMSKPRDDVEENYMFQSKLGKIRARNSS